LSHDRVKESPRIGRHRTNGGGTVVEVFEKPEEGYMVEFLEKDGEISKIADWVKPDQIKNMGRT
jgi:uncharacterized membrane protein